MTMTPNASRHIRAHESGSVVLAGRYEILFELASGGMGTVWVGRRIGAGGFQRLVAIKRMHPAIAEDPECVAAFREEARIASLIQHANVVAIHDVHEDADEHVLVMDYIDGASLATLLGALRARGERPPRAVALRIVIEALRGLHAAHELVGHDGKPLEVVHRDATPHNILIGSDGVVRLTDFGIARAAVRSVHTEPGFAKGKFTYMAPEHAFAEPLDRRADVFTMGVVLWETLTGKRLFANRTAQEVARGAALGQIPKPSEAGADAPPELDALVLRALAPWKEDRWPTAAAFADALFAFASKTGGLASSSHVARLLEDACADTLKERRDRIRARLAALPRAPHADRPPPAESGVVRRDRTLLHRDEEPTVRHGMRISTPQAAAVGRDLAEPIEETASPRVSPSRLSDRARRIRRAVVATVVAALGLAGVLVAAIVAPASRDPVPVARRAGVRVVQIFAEARVAALRR